MKDKLQACCLIAMITWGGTVFSQTKLKSLEDFKTPTGDWFMAKDVKVDSVNHKLFTYAEGGDSFVNGATGKTVHLESKEAFGDIEVHLEFLLPEGSNSGIYFQSRYEIQIFDSYGKENIDFSDCGGIYQRWDESKPKKQKG
ncbi:3-keto-disaccharide hydrolase [Formosa sp. 4Alg 33]|uniref:3-keto-disaccharide hydrolase n=1 Tax=Formosa sp. 4Alg 33 TaxID=3382189 RepID=UPI003D9C09E1